MQDIDIPEVRSIPQRARFYKDGERDYVEISFVGQKDTIIKRVTPEHMAKYKAEWDAYCDGRPPERRRGTPLTELPSINAQRAEHYIHSNIHNLEELAALGDIQCQGVGHGTLTERDHAKKLLANRRREAEEIARKKITDLTSAARSAPETATSELVLIRDDLATLKDAMFMLIEELRRRKGGRPPKESKE